VENRTGLERWHYGFRESRWETYREAHGYAAMARAMKEEIGNLRSLPRPKKQEREIRWLQPSPNQILSLHLVVDGIFGDKTRARIQEILQESGYTRRTQILGLHVPLLWTHDGVRNTCHVSDMPAYFRLVLHPDPGALNTGYPGATGIPLSGWVGEEKRRARAGHRRHRSCSIVASR
jgi:hypothetical protein